MATRSRTAAAAQDIAFALQAIDTLRAAARSAEKEYAGAIAAVAPGHRASARNLAHYLAVRRHDLRALQPVLERLGLSSLGRMEAHVMASLDAVGAALACLARPARFAVAPAAPAGFASGPDRLRRNADALLGPCTDQRPARLMVTLPSEAADDPALVHALVGHGMDIARINCAHDDRRAWARMVRHVRAAERATGRRCRISFDLGGPKLRTGPIEAGPQVLRAKPVRDRLGRVIEPARITLRAMTAPAGEDDRSLPVDDPLLARMRAGDVLSLTDARGKERHLMVVGATREAALCESDATVYLVPGLRLTLRRDGRRIARGHVGELPATDQALMLRAGDTLELFHGAGPGREAQRDASGAVLAPARIGCEVPEVFAGVEAGAAIAFDDGRLRGTVTAVGADTLSVSIQSAVGGSAKLAAGKGINLPDADLALAALTARDREDLAFVVKHADMVAMSFVQTPADVEQLLAELARLDATRTGLILKIETRRAFEQLPLLLFAAMRHPRVAVMVARGDLGVEVGFERLSEVQEEILWIAEAAHAPVIWATQVLESLAKGGMPSRAEVTDAAMSGRAECVMLNKGPYIHQTLRFLADVLARMAEHQDKKRALLRKLAVSQPHRRRAPATRRTGRARPAD